MLFNEDLAAGSQFCHRNPPLHPPLSQTIVVTRVTAEDKHVHYMKPVITKSSTSITFKNQYSLLLHGIFSSFGFSFFSDWTKWILMMCVLTMMHPVKVHHISKTLMLYKDSLHYISACPVWFCAPMKLHPAPRSGQLSNSCSPTEWLHPPCSEPALVSPLPGR